jgi:hypothetical protein
MHGGQEGIREGRNSDILVSEADRVPMHIVVEEEVGRESASPLL